MDDDRAVLLGRDVERNPDGEGSTAAGATGCGDERLRDAVAVSIEHLDAHVRLEDVGVTRDENRVADALAGGRLRHDDRLEEIDVVLAIDGLVEDEALTREDVNRGAVEME